VCVSYMYIFIFIIYKQCIFFLFICTSKLPVYIFHMALATIFYRLGTTMYPWYEG